LNAVKSAWRRFFETKLAAIGLTHTQFVVLANTGWLIFEGEMPTQTRIAAQIACDRMMISKVLRALEEKGLVTRLAHPDDPRANRVELTAQGWEALAHGGPMAIAAQEAFFGRLGEAGMMQLATQLGRLMQFEEDGATGAGE
jgi:DNA-binding MarR family transcriptional regulator